VRTGKWEAKELNPPPDRPDRFRQVKQEKTNHLYTFIMRPDQSYDILVDPQPARTPDDPTDRNPADSVDEEYINDSGARKPAVRRSAIRRPDGC
jgi:hypothetical protein